MKWEIWKITVSPFWKFLKHLEKEEICQLNLSAGWNEWKCVTAWIATVKGEWKKSFLWLGFLLSMGKSPNHKTARIHLLANTLISQVAVLAL